MSRTMRAYRITRWGQAPEIVEVPVPDPGSGEVVVQVAGCGLCHSDIGMTQMPREVGEPRGWQMPFTLGHETAGRVAALGPDVTDFAEGDPVALVSPASCGHCWYCTRGQDSSCPNGASGRGYGQDGGLADYVRVTSTRGLIKLNTLDPRTAGPLTDAGATAYHAVRRVLPRVTPGGVAVVIGAGGLGSFAVQYLRILTAARVVAVDTNQARLAFAAELGAHDGLGAQGEAVAETLREMSDGRGADAVLDFVGADATIAAGTAATRPGGAYGLIGAAEGTLDQPWYGGLPKDGEIFTFQGSNIADLQDVIGLAESGAIRNEVQTFPFEDVADAYHQLDAGTLRGRAVVVFDNS
ncbi:alcohol dehydrogenase catalytic domain-containing protein [Nocardia vermiculata]|nr:alcohol dehydrogenase catalytic domain-containing protein [Nocardia vermiculata]